ncbi:F-box containing protein [Brazilian marseillevirus]|uniref:F-box containing protein n=1 Tax=Brazilian marseillevirus TaxID=1813599 RepID=UPI0007846A03|nr:F-box containing protein [Brazilian marseillevirus]AMQ10525.1 F-box containing protein [Brazilian marseillevirus]
METLPVETLAYILKFLDKESKALFLLTCKYHYNLGLEAREKANGVDIFGRKQGSFEETIKVPALLWDSEPYPIPCCYGFCTASGTFLDGKIHGHYIAKAENAQLEGVFDMGRQIGTWRVTSPKVEGFEEQTYDDKGRLLSWTVNLPSINRFEKMTFP